jgi:signal transduction histidine kinase
MTRTAKYRRFLAWLSGFLLWTVIGLSFASQFYVASLKAGRPVSWGEAIGWSLGDWYVWGLLSIPIFALARRFHLEGPQWPARLAIHACGCVVAALIYLFLRAWLGQWQTLLHGRVATFGEIFMPLLAKSFFFNVIVYWVIVCAGHAVDYYQQFRQREWRSVELERNLTQAKLKALQMQLNPHFLFNTLHAISALMHKDVDAADRMIAQLSDLLRRALESGDENEVPLRQELDFLERYLAIEKTRFGARLKVRIEVEADTLDALVPNLLLQPLVENAIQHGIEPQARTGEVAIAARRIGNELILEVQDDGAGLAEDHVENVGLSNTRSRLSQLYGDRHRFELQRRHPVGVAVTAAIPFRLAARAGA